MSAKNTSIALGARYESYVRSKVASGEFATVSEVIRDALRRSEERDARLERLRQLIREGEESGESMPFNFDEFIQEMHARHSRNAA